MPVDTFNTRDVEEEEKTILGMSEAAFYTLVGVTLTIGALCTYIIVAVCYSVKMRFILSERRKSNTTTTIG